MKKHLEDLVYQTLNENKNASSDDFILYGGVLKRMGIELDMSIRTLFSNHKKLGIPSFESVSRCRRKLCETYPYLADKTDIRREEEQKYRDYARK